MSCAACVRRVEQGLSAVEGVNSASVNFATERASVEYDPEAVTSAALRAKVKELGYDVVEAQTAQGETLQKTTVSIGGMTCAACVRRVEAALKALPGVKDASVNLATSRGTVVHDRDLFDVSQLKKTVDDAGYQFLGILGETETDPIEAARRHELTELKLKLVVGVVLSVLIHLGSTPHFFPFLESIPHHLMLLALLAMATPVVFWVGSRFFIGAYKAALQRTTDMNTLVAVGALSAYLYLSW